MFRSPPKEWIQGVISSAFRVSEQPLNDKLQVKYTSLMSRHYNTRLDSFNSGEQSAKYYLEYTQLSQET